MPQSAGQWALHCILRDSGHCTAFARYRAAEKPNSTTWNKCSWHCVRAAGLDRCVDFCIAMERTAASFGCAGPRGCTFLHTPLTVHRCMRGVR